MKQTALSKAKKITISGVLTAVALLFSYVETFVPMPVVGMKLGLANLIPLLLIGTLGVPCAASVSLLRITLSALLFGTPVSFLYSLAGGTVSFLAIVLLTRLTGLGPAGVGCAGGVLHNLGQICVAIAVFETDRLLVLLPVLILSGAVAGFLVGTLAALVLPRFQKIANG